MSSCQIKVLYVGKNRNKTYITKQVAQEIGKTLRGAPIVGYYKEDKEDFSTHGEKVIIDDQGIKFQCMTIPYGFVSPDAKVWFQVFEDIDENGNTVQHQYLMTTGYLWTEQFKESKLPIDQGRPQSMQFEKDSLQGQWKFDFQSGINFFIINDAIIQKLCILGQDVEPCFEGASITSPNVSKNYTLDDNFKITLYSMIQDLKKIVKGEQQQMENLENIVVDEQNSSDVITSTLEYKYDSVEKVEDVEEEDSSNAPIDYVKKDKNDDDDSEEDKNSENTETETEESDSNNDTEKEDDDKKKSSSKKYEFLKDQLENLKNQYTKLQNKYQELIAFKSEIDNQKKQELISEFYMLSDEDKRDVIENINNYSLDEIKSKLAVICFDKKVSFSLDTTNENIGKNEQEAIMTYNLNNDSNNKNIPNWVKEVKKNENII